MQVAFRKTVLGCLVAVGALTTFSANAHEARDWLLKGGITHIDPKSDNGYVLDGVGVNVDGNTRPSFSLTYMATRNIGVELLGAAPFKHDINLSGMGTVGEAKHLPPTLSLQWHFLPESRIQPYVGVGLNYTTFFDTQSPVGDLDIDDSWGLAAQVGVDIKINERY